MEAQSAVAADESSHAAEEALKPAQQHHARTSDQGADLAQLVKVAQWSDPQQASTNDSPAQQRQSSADSTDPSPSARGGEAPNVNPHAADPSFYASDSGPLERKPLASTLEDGAGAIPAVRTLAQVSSHTLRQSPSG